MIQGILGCCYQILIMGCVVVGFCVSCVCEGKGVVEGSFVALVGWLVFGVCGGGEGFGGKVVAAAEPVQGSNDV